MPKKKKNTDPNVADPYAEREASRYENPIPSREYILELVANEGPLDFRTIAAYLSIKGKERRDALSKRLGAMQRDGQILCNRAEEYGVVDKMDLLSGRVEAHRDGYGFLLRDGAEDIYLSANEMRRIFHGDEVLVSAAGANRRGQLEGKVVDIIARNTQRIVGRLKREAGVYFIVPDNPRITHDILIEESDIQSAKPGDYVCVTITSYPTWHNRAVGIVSEVLGAPMAPGLEIEIAIRSHNIPNVWPPELLQEATRLGDEPAESDKKHRIDLRHLPLVTIDGEDARDFDDAVYCEAMGDGGYKLWVAIADVAHYVPVDSALDQQAFLRGNSVYFPGRVVPMLPEAISNGLCSLNPQVDRLCMVAEIDIDKSGQSTNYRFYEAVMHSHARLTYTEVAEALNLLEREPRQGLMKRLHQVLPHLQQLNKLYVLLSKQRERRGAIDFETTETQIVFNENRKIETIVPVTRNDAHKIIEECMLCANVAAAGFLQKSTLDGLYRVHEGPKPEKLKNLRAYLGETGLDLPGGEKPSPKDYQHLMAVIQQRPDAHLIQIMLLRSLSQAVYDLQNEGHFGLAYDAYAHFTSPIRRYPDLLMHRAIKQLIHSRKSTSLVVRPQGTKAVARKILYPYNKEEMLAAGVHCSMTERRADDATRDVMAFLKCEYLLEHVGQQFNGVISGVTGFGMFVELDDLYVEGMVHISGLGKDYFHFDPAMQRLVGERTRQVYRMGDAVSVTVASVDMEQRKIDLILSGGRGHTTSKQVLDSTGRQAKKQADKTPHKSKGRKNNTRAKKSSGKKASKKSYSRKK